MSELKTVCKYLWSGQSILRAYLNLRLAEERLEGKVIDVGGGKNADYISFMDKSEDVDFFSFDIKNGAVINFEEDSLPSEDQKYDTVLLLNVLEHIFNHQHLVNEVIRITKQGGKVIGFVPFLMWYHPDHKDFFRYTHEALEKIFINAGIKEFEIEPIARGPFTASLHIILSTIPTILRVPISIVVMFLDRIFLWLRPSHGSKFALGYFFILKP